MSIKYLNKCQIYTIFLSIDIFNYIDTNIYLRHFFNIAIHIFIYKDFFKI
jgi:hypothetical protein